MALNEFHKNGVIPAEWFTDEAVREARWLVPFAKRISSAFEGHYARQRGAEVAVETPEEAASDTFDELEKRKRNPGFSSPEELLDWVCDHSDAIIGEKGWETWTKFGEKLPVLLLRPLDRYSFEVDMLPAHKFFVHAFRYNSEVVIGGTNELTLQSCPARQDLMGLRVRGAVRAGNITGAHRRIEQVIDELCGAFRALGLARFVPLPPKDMVEFRGQASLPEVRITGWKWDAWPEQLEPSYARRIAGFALTVPEDLDDLKRTKLANDDFVGALGPRHRVLARVLGGTSERSAELRGACRRMVEAELSTDFGITVTLAFSALEGLLLEPTSKDEVLGRLSEAVAHSVANSVEERTSLRKRVKALYGKRSQFVHTGMVKQAAKERDEAIDLGYRVLRHELELLRDV